MNILGVILSEFHHKEGRRLVASDPPENLLSKEQFKLHCDLILPRGSLCGRILAIQFLQDYYLVICPILAQNPEWNAKYKRAIYYYSINQSQQSLYKQVVSKLAKFIQVIEETHHIVYQNLEKPKYAEYLYSILENFRREINTRGQCDLTYFCSHYSFINASKPTHKLETNEHHLNCATVPVTMLSEEEIEKVESELGQQLLRYAYEGNYTLRKICRLHRDRKQAQIRSFYLKGTEKGVIYLLDLLSLNNCYILTDKIKEYLPEQPKHSELAEIARAIALKEEVLEPQELLCIYLQFNRVTALHKIIEINRKLTIKIDVQKLIRYGQICGFLRRLHQKIVYSQFPQPLIMVQALKRVLKQRGSDQADRALRQQSDKFGEAIKNDIMSGLTVDEIMVNLDVDYDRLLKLLNPQNRYIFKVNMAL